MTTEPYTEFTVPEPSFVPTSEQKYLVGFMPRPLIDDVDEMLLYKVIMANLVNKDKRINPDSFFNSYDDETIAKMDAVQQREEYKKRSCDLFDILKDILADESFLCKLADICDCNFVDIIHCLYAYFGELMFKKPQFIRYITKIVAAYSPETREMLGLPVEFKLK